MTLSLAAGLTSLRTSLNTFLLSPPSPSLSLIYIICHFNICTQQQTANNRRKRQGDDPITTFANNLCAPRFIKLENSTMYGLFWDCPDGSSRPNTTIESVLCQRLLQSGLVESCKPTNMTAITATPPSLPKIRSARVKYTLFLLS